MEAQKGPTPEGPAEAGLTLPAAAVGMPGPMAHWRPLIARWATRARTTSPAFYLVLVAASGYVVVLTYLALSKYATFHATFDDLGIENQVLWLLSHGGIGAYNGSGFSQIYPLQLQKPILFLVLPIYALYPHPETLLVLATVALGAAAVPLYLAANRWLARPEYAAVLSVAYLLYFPVASANLFDFHYEDLFPLLFFSMVWAHSAGRVRTMLAAAVLTAMVNPLALVSAVFFLLFTCLPAPRTTPLSGWPRMAWQSILKDLRVPLVGLLLLALLVVYRLAGTLYTAGVGGAPGTSSVWLVLAGYPNDKLTLAVLLLGALAFLPFYSARGLVAALPYFGYVSYSLNSANFQPFGLMYPLLGTGPLFLAALDGLRAWGGPGGRATEVRRAVAAPPTAPEPSGPPARWSPGPTPHPQSGMVRALALSTVLFALVFFPISPVNGYVAGGYFAGNHDVANITDSTAATRFLTQVVSLVPPTASVLTQNNIPQLSGRMHVQIASDYFPSIPYDAIVMDSEVNYFSTPSTILPFVQAALANGTFRIVAEGQGALYLQAGYVGAPELYQPLNESFLGTALTPLLSHPNGTALVGSGPGFSLWYGPFLTLYPGNYTARFHLASNTTVSSTKSAVTIDVTANKGATILATQTLFPQNFSAPFAEATFALHFVVANALTFVELRGMFPSGVATITLDGIDLAQTGTAP